ncbi:MAG: dihydrofolate reductase [Treponema sp.]|nr:dihydrofolate reductase [Candidatus Treponema equifaecale]
MLNSTHLFAILARDSQNHIANKAVLPWHKDSSTKWDMENFKRLTTNNIIYMGYNTALTFQKPLPDRINVIEDRNSTMFSSEIENLFITAPSLEAFITQNKALFENQWKDKKIFLIGGAKLLKKYAELIDKFYLTTFSVPYAGDIFFDESILKNFSKRKTIETHPNGVIELFSN